MTTDTEICAAATAADSPLAPLRALAAALPPLGAPLAGGTYRGITVDADGIYYAIALLPDLPPRRLTWQAAVDWAAGLGNGARLFNRAIGAQLFSIARGEFERDWYWTSETDQDDGSYAWLQLFSYGGQSFHHKSYEGRARAVRLIPLNPSVLQPAD